VFIDLNRAPSVNNIPLRFEQILEFHTQITINSMGGQSIRCATPPDLWVVQIAAIFVHEPYYYP